MRAARVDQNLGNIKKIGFCAAYDKRSSVCTVIRVRNKYRLISAPIERKVSGNRVRYCARLKRRSGNLFKNPFFNSSKIEMMFPTIVSRQRLERVNSNSSYLDKLRKYYGMF